MPEHRIPTREEVMGALADTAPFPGFTKEEFADAVIQGCKEGRFKWDGVNLSLTSHVYN